MNEPYNISLDELCKWEKEFDSYVGLEDGSEADETLQIEKSFYFMHKIYYKGRYNIHDFFKVF